MMMRSSSSMCSGGEILQQTSSFLSETVSQPPQLRHHLYSTFLKALPPTLITPLTLASQALETAISGGDSSLRLAEKLLLSIPSNPFSSFLQSLLHHLSHRAVDASMKLLDVFEAEPSFSRVEMAPFVFEELFLVHLGDVVAWYSQQRSRIVSRVSSLALMSEDQAWALRDLERDYQVLLDQNCRALVKYFKDILRADDDDGDGDLSPPRVMLFWKNDEADCHGFESPNRRYNAEADWVELNSNKFPSLFPVRVSPNILINQNNIHHLQQKRPALFDSNKTQPTVSPEPSQRSGHHHLMEEEEEEDEEVSVKLPPPPKDFVCPITTHIFEDPVTLETGQTYERHAIREWLARGNRTCPITRHTLRSLHLPKTNYVLKRLIATWRENMDHHNNNSNNDNTELTIKRSTSPRSVIDAATAELRLAITHLCTSEILGEAEAAVLRILRFWKDKASMELQVLLSMLARPPVINGLAEILLNSVDARVLRAAVFLLTELGCRDDTVAQTLTRVDSDVEAIVELLKKGLVEAVVLVYLLRPEPASLVEMDLVGHLLEMLEGGSRGDGVDGDRMFMEPETAAVLLLASIVQHASEGTAAEAARSIAGSGGAMERIVRSVGAEEDEERVGAVRILVRCMVEDGKCRNMVGDKAQLGGLLESFVRVGDGERLEIIHFFSQLLKLNRRNLNEQILQLLKEEGSLSTMHTLLTYLQHAPLDHTPLVAGLLLQLDLLEEPRKMSIYREEAIDSLIYCLRNSESTSAQISAAETILSLQGSFSYSGKSLSRAILLKRAGLQNNYLAFMRRDQRRHNISPMEDEKGGEEWERKVAFSLVSHEFGLVFEALAHGLTTTSEDLYCVCFMAATWLVYMLSLLPDTGIRGAARVCLLNHFVSVFISEKNLEDRALAMLALNTFISDPEGLQDVASDMKEILKGLRELKKSSAMAFDMLKVFSEEHDNSADIWNHKEVSEEDCSINGEVVSVSCFKAKIFSGHSDGTIKVWSAGGPELQLIQEIREHTKPVTALTVLHSSEKLYSGSLDRTIRIWSVSEDGIYCEQVEEVKDPINKLVVANNIACFIPQGGGVKVHSWNGSSKVLNQQKYVRSLGLVQGKLYCGCNDSSIQEIDLATGTVGNIQSGSKKLIGKAYPVYALQLHDGLLYAAGPSLDGANVKIWSTSNYSMVGSLASTLDIRSMAVSSELVYLGSKMGSIEVWCRKKHNRVETLVTNPNTKILCMALDANQDMLVIGTSDGRIQTWGLS